MNNTSFFTNVFKSLFGSSITPTASQFVPITAQDGTPAGVSSMANLVSVLGETSATITSDLNTIFKAGIYRCNQTTTGRPSNIYYPTVVVYVRSGAGAASDTIHQVAFDSDNNQPMAYRIGTTESWGEWKTIYDSSILTNSTILSSLASALGDSVNVRLVLSTNQSPSLIKKKITLSSYGVAELTFLPNGGGRLYVRIMNRSTLTGEFVTQKSESFVMENVVLDKTNTTYIIGMKGEWSNVYITPIKGTYTVEDYDE